MTIFRYESKKLDDFPNILCEQKLQRQSFYQKLILWNNQYDNESNIYLVSQKQIE